MTDNPVVGAATTLPLSADPHVGDFIRLSRGFRSGATARWAWSTSFAILGLVIFNISVAYGLNQWNRAFF